MPSHYFELASRSLFYREFFYFDIPDYVADDIFVKYRVIPKFYQELGVPGDPYVLIRCRVRRTQVHAFLKAMDELPTKMRLLGYTDFEDYCDKTMDKLSQELDSDEIDPGEYEHLRATVENLTLYLKHIQDNNPDLFKALEDHFDGLPGYSGRTDT